MLPPTYTSCDYRCVTFVSLSSTCVTPGISRRTHHEGEPCNGVYMCVARIVLSFVAWRPLLLLRDTIIKYAVQGTRYDTSSGAINPSKYQESCRCRLETRIYFSIRYEIIIVCKTHLIYDMESSTRTQTSFCHVPNPRTLQHHRPSRNTGQLNPHRELALYSYRHAPRDTMKILVPCASPTRQYIISYT